MSIWRFLGCIFLPPLSVFDRGCGSFLVVLVLSTLGWVPGVLAAFYINMQAANKAKN